MAPPERPRGFFIPLSELVRSESEGDIIDGEGTIVLRREAVSVVVGIGGDDGGSVDSDVDEEEPMVSEVFVTAGRVELSTEAGMDGPSDATTITMDVETCTTVVGVGVSPLTEAGALTVNVVICTGVPVVRKV